MRIISGQRRGHKIDGPRNDATRPTSDLVRESLFNILRDQVEDRPVIDLFAGTGALGLEALSRGAIQARFVELDRDNAALVRRNLATLRFEDRGTVVVTDVYRWARAFEPQDDTPHLVFVDPPYREYDNHPDRVRNLIEGLLSRLPNGSVLVVESGRDHGPDVLPDPDLWDRRRYGSTRVAIRTLGESSAVEPESDDDA